MEVWANQVKDDVDKEFGEEEIQTGLDEIKSKRALLIRVKVFSSAQIIKIWDWNNTMTPHFYSNFLKVMIFTKTRTTRSNKLGPYYSVWGKPRYLLISWFHCDLSHSTVCKFIVNRQILLYQDFFDQSYSTVPVSLCLKTSLPLLQC